MMDLDTKFMYTISKCTDPTIFIGVARILGVDILGKEKDKDGHFIPRDFSEIVVDVVDAYSAAPRKRKRELVKIFDKANKEVINAPRTKNTKTKDTN